MSCEKFKEVPENLQSSIPKNISKRIKSLVDSLGETDDPGFKPDQVDNTAAILTIAIELREEVKRRKLFQESQRLSLSEQKV